MRTIGVALQAHIDLEVTTLALCWKVTRRDAVVEGWTDHDENITYDGVVYYPLG